MSSLFWSSLQPLCLPNFFPAWCSKQWCYLYSLGLAVAGLNSILLEAERSRSWLVGPTTLSLTVQKHWRPFSWSRIQSRISYYILQTYLCCVPQTVTPHSFLTLTLKSLPSYFYTSTKSQMVVSQIEVHWCFLMIRLKIHIFGKKDVKAMSLLAHPKGGCQYNFHWCQYNFHWAVDVDLLLKVMSAGKVP